MIGCRADAPRGCLDLTGILNHTMRFEAGQHMRLGQQMRLAPRMIQSMEILQLSLMALEERIAQEIESNIALEQVETQPDDTASAEAADEASSERIERSELVAGDGHDFERLSDFASRHGEIFEDDDQPRARVRNDERDGKMDAMANAAARGESLTEQLQHQWSFFDLDAPILEAGRLLIQYINEDGLLGTDLETILEQNRHVPGVELSAELLEAALHEMRNRLEPTGVGARSVRECLLLQVDHFAAEAEDDRVREAWEDVRELITDHFDDLVQNRLPRIEQRAGMPIERIRAAMERMKLLNLSPGRDLVDEEVAPIIPDVVVEYDEAADEYIARLADDRLPRLRVSRQYEKMAKDREYDKSTREFVSDNVMRARWLIDAVNQRRSTLLRVVNVVLARQRESFDYGMQHLKPLPMIEVADQLGIHVGTVSRAVADKWLQTPRGLVSLRKFFSGGAKTESGDEMSWEAMRALLKEIVDQEDKSRPLSDDALAEELRKRGIDIARRTVVKYRSQLGIPTARLRKQH